MGARILPGRAEQEVSRDNKKLCAWQQCTCLKGPCLGSAAAEGAVQDSRVSSAKAPMPAHMYRLVGVGTLTQCDVRQHVQQSSPQTSQKGLQLTLSLLVVVRRPDYMTTFVDKLIDWDNVAKRFEAATK